MMAFQMMAAFATTTSVVTICTKAVTVPVTGIDKAIPLGGTKNKNPPQVDPAVDGNCGSRSRGVRDRHNLNM